MNNFKNTTLGKTVRTFLQSAAGILLLLVLSEDFRTYITTNHPELAVYIPLAVALFTAIHNGLDKGVPNLPGSL